MSNKKNTSENIEKIIAGSVSAEAAGETREKKYQLLHEELLATHEELVASEEELRQQFDELLLKEEKIYRQNTVLNLLHDMALALMTDIGHDDVLEKIIAGAVELFGTPNSFIHFVNEAKGTFYLRKATGIFTKFEYKGKTDEGLFGRAYKTGRLTFVENYNVWEHRFPYPEFDEVHYFVLVPLKNRDKMIGTIGLVFTEPGRVMSEDELSLLQRFADLASLALSNDELVSSLNEEIQKRRQTEESLRQSEETFYTIFQMSPSAICLARQDGTYMNVNESFCKSTGYAKEELIGAFREQVGLWRNEQDKQLVFTELKNQREVNNLESWFRRKDGNDICGLMSARLVPIQGEECILTVTTDITEPKKNEERLRLSEEKFSQAFYLSPDAIVICRMDGTLLEVNEAFTKMHGFANNEAIGRKTVELGIWPDPREREHMTDHVKQHGEIRNMKVRLCNKDGRLLYGQLSGRVLTIEGEACLMLVLRDITEQVEIEQERRRQEAALLVSKNKLFLAAQLANLGPWEYHPATNLFEFSDEFYALYGTDAAREGRCMSLEQYITEFVHPEDAGIVTAEMEKVLLSAQRSYSTQFETRIIRRDGQIRTVVVQASMRKDAAGNIIAGFGANQDITERVQADEERRKQAEIIQRMAYYDPVTGLPNRYHLNERLEREMEQARQGNASGVVLFVDLDDLKLVNDTYGHSCGDAIITAAGAKIIAEAGQEAFVARIGGDEFVVISPGEYTREQTDALVYKISKALGRKQEVAGTYFHMTASIGIAAYPADGDTAEEIIKNADNAMYAAKKAGKNCWCFYTEVMQAEAYKRMRLTSGLRNALERGEFYLAYQPQIHTEKRNVTGFEALLRWASPEYGMVSPAQFIPLAEQSGMIHTIGQWVLHEACRFVRRLTDSGWGEMHVAVNISSKQLAVGDFVELVSHAVTAAGIEPHQLELEITESLLMASIEDATGKLAKLKALGVRLSLDDFGSGYSSLTYLRQLPVETLKIDKSFIDMIAVDATGTKIIASIINMAHTLSMSVIAEGVETEQQLNYLACNGCDCIQGYLFSRPVSEPEAIRFLTAYPDSE